MSDDDLAEQLDREADRYENEALVIGALFISLTAPGIALDPATIEIDQSRPAILLDLDFMLSRYRITVERLDE